MPTPVKHFYCHIPFCPSKCAYCAFVTHVGSLALVPRYLEALEQDFARLAAQRAGGPLATVYFGGGTPSMLAPADVLRLLAALQARFGLEADAEITLEAHPDTVDEEKLLGFREAGVTRLSMGAESLQPGELAVLGRAYASDRIHQVVEWARDIAFGSLALDLMYGLPGQSTSSWQQTLERVLALAPDHLSLYPLSIEPQTVFARRRREGRLAVPGDVAVAGMYALACELLAGAGYEHYEVANWARPGHACRHNIAYWHNREFYGAGVGAHGYLHPVRYENVRQTKRYIETTLDGGDAVAHAEVIDDATHTAETIMLRLRLLREGLDCDRLHAETGMDMRAERGQEIDRLCRAGLVRVSGRRLILNEQSALLAHEALVALM